MKRICLLSIVFLFQHLTAQTIIQRDTEVEKMVKEVSSDSLRFYINTLVAFGTRNTLSTQTDPERGIGAAKNWVLKKFNEFAKQSNGRLTAIIDTTTLHADNKRVDTT
jgi:uncharacterized protein YmfQ (DUF2313 family)